MLVNCRIFSSASAELSAAQPHPSGSGSAVSENHLIMQITLRRTLTLRLAKLANNSHSSLRCFATEAPRIKHYDYAVTDVAVLGGGITGLTSAFYLSQAFPSAKITVFETSDRFGGWVRSSKLDVGGKDVYFEHGPRTLRPNDTNALATLDLVCPISLMARKCGLIVF